VDAGGEWEAGVVKGGVALEVDTAEDWLVGEEARSEEKGHALWVLKETGGEVAWFWLGGATGNDWTRGSRKMAVGSGGMAGLSAEGDGAELVVPSV
jgi:hypothetical protein